MNTIKIKKTRLSETLETYIISIWQPYFYKQYNKHVLIKVLFNLLHNNDRQQNYTVIELKTALFFQFLRPWSLFKEYTYRL